MLQHKNEYDEQDSKFEMDKPYIEYCGQGWSWYGHINRFEILRDRIKVEMNAAAAERMGNDGHLEVLFSLDEPTFSKLLFALKTVFHAQNYFVEAV